MKIGIVGSGSWGMALANHLANQDNEVKIWSFTEEEKNLINNEHKCMFIPDMILNETIYCSNDIDEVTKDAEVIFHVSPSKFTRNIFKDYKHNAVGKPVIICSKGFEDATLTTLDKVFEEELPGVRIAALSGPSYASEVSNGIPTAIILASKDNELLEQVSVLLSNETMRVYKSNDIVGAEVGGALKNIIAFCNGICVELGLGMNAQAAVITRGLAEIARLGVQMGGVHDTFYGLSGLGDLILTCSSDESRNRRAGRLIGKGYTIDEAKKEIGQTIESFDNIEIAKQLSDKYNVEMPIVNAVYDVVFNGVEPREAGRRLMTRGLKFENDFSK